MPEAPGDSVYDALPADFFVDSAQGLSNPYDCETPGFGRVESTTLVELRRQAMLAIGKLRTAEVTVQTHHNPIDKSLGSMLRIMLRNAVDRLEHLPCTKMHALVTVRMAHRLILEICGLTIYYTTIVSRISNPISQGTYPLLRVRGALVRNGATAQTLHRLGVPFWFIQRFRPDIFVQRVIPITPWTDVMDATPVGMKVPKSWYDANGTNQDSARWVHPSLMYVCSTLCSSRLPRLEDVTVAASEDAEPSAKKFKGPSGLAVQRETTTGDGHSKPKKTRRGGKKHRDEHAKQRPQHPASAYQPPPTDILADTLNWKYALTAVSPLRCPPPKAAVYFFPPAFLFTTAGDKLGRYIHNYARICIFCRQRLLEPHFDGRPLKIADWRHALHGDYKLDEALPDGQDRSVGCGKAQLRHEHKQAVRKLFAKSAGLASYSEDMLPKFRRD